MLLAIDIGNTNVTLGVFEGEKLRATWRLATDVRRMADEYAVIILNLLPRSSLSEQDITHGIICSVVPTLTPVFGELCRSYLRVDPMIVDVGTRTGIRVLYENPREVGADRVADAAAAYRLYGGPAIVVDFGTATVFDAISKEGDYLGGAIAPGIGIAAEALFARAARLYRVELTRPRRAIGRNTAASMQSGIMFGYVGLVEGLIARFQRELGTKAKVIATGGLAEIMARETPVIDVVDVDLTLSGLRIIHDINLGETPR